MPANRSLFDAEDGTARTLPSALPAFARVSLNSGLNTEAARRAPVRVYHGPSRLIMVGTFDAGVPDDRPLHRGRAGRPARARTKAGYGPWQSLPRPGDNRMRDRFRVDVVHHGRSFSGVCILMVSTHATRRPGKPRGALVLRLTAVIVLVAVLGLVYASPYIALERLKQAADRRDAETVSQYVDFPSLRESLKQQVSGLLARRLDAGSQGNPLAVVGAMIGAALIGPLVNAYATPEGVAALLNGMPPRGEPGEQPPATLLDAQPAAAPDNAISSAPARGAPPQPPHTAAGYRGINEFVVTYQHGVGDTRYAAILRRDGLFSWKLAAVDLGGQSDR